MSNRATRTRVFSCVAAALLLAGCAGTGHRGPDPGISVAELLSGAAVFGARVDTSRIPDPGLFELDDDMRDFVAEQIEDAGAERDRMRRLLSGMIETGLMSLDYNDTKTKTARQTFHQRVGNCMSFTSLFVALAREADLDVAFQVVDIPPVWSADSDLVILNSHVNAVVRQNFGARVVVDFNVTELKGDFDSFEVSDDYALALYFNNVAMDALRAGDYEESFGLLKKSIETYPEIAANWANLGVIYSRLDANDHAIQSYLVALDLDKRHRPSLVNLAALYRSMGEDRYADYYAARINRYQKQNPYYHYYQAVADYNNDELDAAMKDLRRAIRIDSDDHRFFRLLGQIYERQGNAEMALSSFKRARDLAVFSDAKSIYSSKIALLSDGG